MITREDINEEMATAEKIIKDPKIKVDEKIVSLFKLLTIVIKLALNVRTNTTLIMDKVGAEKITPKKPEDKE